MSSTRSNSLNVWLPLSPGCQVCGPHPRAALCRPDKHEAGAADAKPPPTVKSPSAEAAEILATSGGLAKGGAHAPTPPAVTSVPPAAAAPVGIQAAPPTSNAAPMNDRQAGAMAVSMPAAAPVVSAVAPPQGTGPASATHAQQQPAAAVPVSLPASGAGTASAPPVSVPVLSTSEAHAAAPAAVPASAPGPASVAVAASPSTAQAAPQSAPATPVRHSRLLVAQRPCRLRPSTQAPKSRCISADGGSPGGMHSPLLRAALHHMPQETSVAAQRDSSSGQPLAA